MIDIDVDIRCCVYAFRSDLTPFMLFVKHNEKSGNDKEKLRRQYNTLEDSEKIVWIKKAITAYEVRSK